MGVESAILTATCSAGETPQWYTAAGVLFTNLTVSPAVTTDYFVGCKNTATGCETAGGNRAKVTITVTPIPTAPTSANLKGDAICQPGVVNLTATCATGAIAQWYNGNTASSVFLFAGSAYSPTISATTTYFVGCKNSTTGCETAASARASVVGTLNPNLPAPANAQASKGIVCINETYTLSASCGTNQSVQWYTTNTASGVIFTNLTYTQTSAGTYNYYVGCKDNTTLCETLPNSRAKVSVVVLPYPPAPTNATSSKSAICIGESVVLSASCGAGETAQWYTSAGSFNQFNGNPKSSRDSNV
ncbi:MAG: hypothetical protein U5N85_02745 [Arcicella sp.]|nr:hypothetical protein [Arcicella sp.]